MKYLLVVLMLLFSQPALHQNVYGQTDISHQLIKDSLDNAIHDEAISGNTDDDEFNIFLLFFAIVLLGAMFGAAVVGAFAATLLLLMLIAFVALGIITSSVLIGLYKRSFQAGFKSFVIVLSAIAGTILGAGGVWVVKAALKLDMTDASALLSGSIGGLIGGFIIGLFVIKIMQAILAAFKKRMNLS